MAGGTRVPRLIHPSDNANRRTPCTTSSCTTMNTKATQPADCSGATSDRAPKPFHRVNFIPLRDSNRSRRRAFNPAAGTYSSAQSVVITSAETGAFIRYTTDGSTPPTSSTGTLYSGPVPVSSTTTLKAIAFKTGHDRQLRDKRNLYDQYCSDLHSDGNRRHRRQASMRLTLLST